VGLGYKMSLAASRRPQHSMTFDTALDTHTHTLACGLSSLVRAAALVLVRTTKARAVVEETCAVSSLLPAGFSIICRV